MRETADRLTSVTRRLTAERGLAGFTIDEVCEQVDVSRRTFFNYFPSKEDAVLGADPKEELASFAGEFLARGSRGWEVVIDDLVDVVVSHFEIMGHDAAGHAEFFSALEREPRLFLKFMGVSRERERQAVALVATREGVAADDQRAEAVIAVLSTLLRSTGEKFFDPNTTGEFDVALRENLASLRTVLASASPRKASQ